MMTYRLNDVRTLCALLCLLLRYTVGQIFTEEYLPQDLACKTTMLRSEEGVYSYVSNGEAKYCGLYVVAPIDKVVAIEFTAFDVSCAQGGAVAIFDGWEVDHSIFPSDEDFVGSSRSSRYVQFCGGKMPTRRRYKAKQNAAHIQMFIPNAGDGFSVSVTFITNRKPCNLLLMGDHMNGITLKNYGMQRNCSVLSFYPQEIRFSWFNVGERRSNPHIFARDIQIDTDLRTQCNDGGHGIDRIELYQGIGVGQEGRQMVAGFCGRRLFTVPRSIILGCESTAVRLVSSGTFYNSINFSLHPVEDEDRTC